MSTQGKHWVVRNQFRKWKDEIIEWVRSICPASEHGYQNRRQIVDELNRRFGTDFTLNSFVTHVNECGIQLGFAYSANSQNRGQKHWRHRPVGSFQEKKGYLRIKVAEPNQWMQYQRYVWEQAHPGESAEGKFVIFLDGNNRNFSLDNLTVVTRGELAVMAEMGNRKDMTPQERWTLILRARLKIQNAKLLGSKKATQLSRHLYYERVKASPQYELIRKRSTEAARKRREDPAYREHINELQRARRARLKGLSG